MIITDLRQLDCDLDEIQELDHREIITRKLEAAVSQKLVSAEDTLLVEDISLVCPGMGGLPGPLVKWFLKALGPAGLAELIIKTGDCTAHVNCQLGIWNAGAISFLTAEIDGTIVQPRGQGFGWDSIFQPAGAAHTFGEMTLAEKSSYSTRARVFRDFNKMLGN